jgi:hypothetical protein
MQELALHGFRLQNPVVHAMEIRLLSADDSKKDAKVICPTKALRSDCTGRTFGKGELQ